MIYFWSTMRHLFLPAATLAAVLSCATIAGAQQQDAAIAEQLFRDGRDLLEAGKVDQACEKFAESQRVAPAPGTLLNLAVCREKQGKTATAWSLFADVAAEALRSGDAARAKFANDHEAALAGHLCKIVIDATSPPQGTVLRLDGKVLPEGVLGTAIPVDPGAHALEVTAPGKEPWQAAQLQVNDPASPLHVRVELRDAGAPQAASPAAQTSVAEDRTGRRVGWPVFAAFGVGAAGLITGGIAGGLALGDASQAKANCQGSRCPASGQGPANSAKTLATISDVGFGVAVLGAAVGAVLWIWAPRETGDAAAAIVVAPTSLRLQGVF